MNMKKTIALASVAAALMATVPAAQALDLDWSGQFRAEAAWIKNYQMDGGEVSYGIDTARDGANGYYVRGGGSKTAQFQTLFARLRPTLIVNDNVSIKSEWWLGNPIYGFYGNGFPTSTDQRYFNSSFSGGSTISAQRVWAEFLTDFGTLHVGRAPLDWGLGLVWNAGDGVFDRYQSTGDTIRMVAKFGNFSLIPAATKYNFGNNVGGYCTGGNPCTTVGQGGGGLSDYSLGLRYESAEDDFEGGVNFIRRVGGPNSSPVYINGVTPGGLNYTMWDLYGKKRAGKFDFGFEAPIVNGSMIGIPYKTFALALEANYRANDTWAFHLKAGKAPGQAGNASGLTTSKWKTFYFHPAYKLGVLMFNYQFANFAGPNTSGDQSIYDNPITNASYLMGGVSLTTDKWKFTTQLVTAKADETAQQGSNFFNSWDRRYVLTNAAAGSQADGLGTELDFGVAMRWDDNTLFGVDVGWLMPGKFYQFSNTATLNNTDNVFGVIGKVGINF